MLAIGSDQPDFLDPNSFVKTMVFSADVTLSFLELVKPPGEPAPGGYRAKS
jgi:hypothetical protein